MALSDYADDASSLIGLAPDDMETQAARTRALRGQPAHTLPSQGVPADSTPLGSGLSLNQPSGQGLSAPAYGASDSSPAPAAAPAAAPSSGALSADDLNKQAMALYQQSMAGNKPFDPAPYEQLAQQRGEAANRNFLAGLALSSLGGEAFAPAGGQVLKQAIAMQGPQDVAGGMGTIEGGKFIPNQMKIQEMQAADQQRQANFLKDVAATTSNEQLRQQAQQQAADAERRADEFKRLSLAQTGAYQQAELGLRRQQAQLEGYKVITDPWGRQVLVDVRTGQPVGGGMGAGGAGAPGGGQQMPDTLPLHANDVDKGNYTSTRDTLTGAKNAVDTVNAYPGAFGAGASAASAIHHVPLAGPVLESMYLSPEEKQARAQVASFATSQLIALKRAATNPAVIKQLDSYRISDDDRPEDIIDKLRGIAQVAQDQRGNLRKAYGMGDMPDPFKYDVSTLQYRGRAGKQAKAGEGQDIDWSQGGGG